MFKHCAILLLFLSGAAAAAEPAALVQTYTAEARKADPGFAPSAAHGEAFFRAERLTADGRASCAGCHTADPRREGQTRARKVIAPLAPVANPERLTDAAKAEKWFRRNCQDVVGRACTSAEKADFAAWLISIR
jgi:cytochrome c peroxidase